MKKIRKCGKCGAFTLSMKCRKCGGGTRTTNPPKYSPEDKWADYRRKFKLMSAGSA